MLSNRILEITNIQESAAGIYTCVATHPLSGATINSTVNVTVQCECQANCIHESMYYIHVQKVICLKGELGTGKYAEL